MYPEEPDFVECQRCGDYMVPKSLTQDQKHYFDGCPGYKCPNCYYSESYLPPADQIIQLFRENMLRAIERQRLRRQRREQEFDVGKNEGFDTDTD